MDLTNLIPEGAAIVGVVASVTYLTRDGGYELQHFVDGLSPWEARGMLESARDEVRNSMVYPDE